MNRRLTKWFTAVNAMLIRVSKGRIGSQLGTQSILILHTTGRKSGRLHSTPVAYFEHDGRYLLVGTNWGRPEHPDWVLNLRKEPRARIDVKGRAYSVRGREAGDEEYERLWNFVNSRHAQYASYQRSMTRQVPIVVLERAG